ncbi:tumor necrosis factor receptor superfamily member 8 isoform X3 [Apodemus sylvaticus]|uniref:tumor necrosis factor receptor superfamily member 8 isoform X3 n=1 Tax=Apodemus sylvaticus TaxID=10129 RepID=UPI00224319FF|nr:tumor necrosis factor receptor superfamily member 8 isoform X3 [Apodemus sylvaticus]
MSALRTAVGLLILGMLQAFPTDRLKTPCPGDLRYNPGAADKNCCYQCPSGLSPTQPCPQSPAHCRKQCAPDYYINEYGKCTACVTCLSGLVEKAPCSRNSPRVCECQPGMYCSTPAVNSCARCELQGPEAKGVKFPGTAEKVTIYELPSLGSGPNCSSPDDCKRLTSHATPRATPTLESPTNDTVRSLLPKGVTSLVQEDAMELVKVLESSSSKAREPNPDPGPMLLWVAMVVLLVGSGSFLLCYWKACRRQIQQKFHLNYLVHTFQPKMEQADSCPTEKLTQLQRSGSVTDLSSGNKVSPVSPVSRPAVETCANIGAACLESLPLLDDSTAGGPFSPREPPEPRVSTEHTNNRIEKIYIMKADTVIVGSVKTEVPEGRAPAGSTESDLEAELEVDHAPHYPEQETEPPLGSCTEVMFSVEEGGKEDHGPTTVSEK